MNISFNELRKIKHSLPTGSVAKIAKQLNIDEQTGRNYFGANKYINGDTCGNHMQPGPNGGIVRIEDTTILKAARSLLRDSPSQMN